DPEGARRPPRGPERDDEDFLRAEPRPPKPGGRRAGAVCVPRGGPGLPAADDGPPRHGAEGRLHRGHRPPPDGARGRGRDPWVAPDPPGVPGSEAGEGAVRPRRDRLPELPLRPREDDGPADGPVPLLHVPPRARRHGRPDLGGDGPILAVPEPRGLPRGRCDPAEVRGRWRRPRLRGDPVPEDAAREPPPGLVPPGRRGRRVRRPPPGP